ncbi:MAG: hypothetical protein HON18_04635 [Rhodospirillaceae bacterium]|jgi:hypothetical protein|nr:hypothetical protein [Rhodospirillaceae bacterium]
MALDVNWLSDHAVSWFGDSGWFVYDQLGDGFRFFVRQPKFKTPIVSVNGRANIN